MTAKNKHRDPHTGAQWIADAPEIHHSLEESASEATTPEQDQELAAAVADAEASKQP